MHGVLFLERGRRDAKEKKTGERQSDGKGVMETRWKDEFRWDLDEREDRGQVFGAPCYHKGEGELSVRVPGE